MPVHLFLTSSRVNFWLPLSSVCRCASDMSIDRTCLVHLFVSRILIWNSCPAPTVAIVAIAASAVPATRSGHNPRPFSSIPTRSFDWLRWTKNETRRTPKEERMETAQTKRNKAQTCTHNTITRAATRRDPLSTFRRGADAVCWFCVRAGLLWCRNNGRPGLTLRWPQMTKSRQWNARQRIAQENTRRPVLLFVARLMPLDLVERVDPLAARTVINGTTWKEPRGMNKYTTSVECRSERRQLLPSGRLPSTRDKNASDLWRRERRWLCPEASLMTVVAGAAVSLPIAQLGDVLPVRVSPSSSVVPWSWLAAAATAAAAAAAVFMAVVPKFRATVLAQAVSNNVRRW